jgi:hypothetical protein
LEGDLKKMDSKVIFVKIGQLQHIARLRDEGILYMNNLPYFWQLEDDEVRGDRHDGLKEFHRGPFARAFKDGTELPVRIANWSFRIPPEEPERINIFCMCAFRQPGDPIDKRVLRFGASALVVTDLRAFMARIWACLEKEGTTPCEADYVEYVPNDYVGEIGPFRKFERFSWQSEWRMVARGGPGGPRWLSIGSLRDIAIVVPTSELDATLKSDR